MTVLPLLLSAASVDVTPPAGHPLDGYADRVGVSTGTADPLRADLIWLGSDDDPGVLWLTLDALAVDTRLAQDLGAAAAGAAGIDPDRVLVCASHSHSAPAGWTDPLHPGVAYPREPSLAEALVTAVGAVRLSRRPVTASWTSVTTAGLGANRTHPDGPYDGTAGVLVLRHDGDVASLLVDFACHPTVLGPENLSWSADWPGATRHRLRTTYPGAVVAFLQGAAGDVSPRFTRRSRSFAEVDRLGALLADPVVAALGNTATEHPLSGVPQLRRSTVRLPVRPLPDTATSAAQIAAAELAAELPAVAAAAGRDAGGRLARSRLEGARAQQAMLAGLPDSIELPISAVTFGDVAWAHLPVELFVSLGRRITAAGVHPVTRVVGYTDGYFGYVVDAEAAGGYEAMSSYFDPARSDQLVDAAIALLHQMPITRHK